MTTLAIGLGMARHQISVLVVEDSLDHRVLMERRLREAGMEVRVAGDADEAMRQVDDVDHGVGLQPREAARVFQPFFRTSHSVANAVRGSGIGLSLVQDYVRAMGGEVGVSSQPGAGSTFWFTVPLAGESPDVAADDRQGSRRE